METKIYTAYGSNRNLEQMSVRIKLGVKVKKAMVYVMTEEYTI